MTIASVTASGGVLRQSRGEEGTPRRVLGGACAELARRLNAPVGFLRGLVVVACWFSPRLVLVYVAAVLLVPRGMRRWPGWGNLIGGLRVGVLYGVLFAVAGGGVLGSPMFDQSPAVWITQGGVALVTIVVLFASPGVDSERHQRELALASLALIAVAGALVLGMIVAPQIRWEQVAAAVVVLTGGVLVVGGRRARGLLLPAVVAASGLVLLAASGARLQGGIGHTHVRPVRLAALAPSYRLAIGTLHVDLSALAASGRVLTLTVSVGVGDLELTVPATATVEIDAHVGRGSFFTTLPGNASLPVTGFAIHRRFSSAALSGSTGPAISPSALARLRSQLAMRVRVDADVGIGTLRIDRGGIAAGAPGPS